MNTAKLTNAFTISEGMLVRHRTSGTVAQVTRNVRSQNGLLIVTLSTADAPIKKARLDLFWRYWAPLLG